MKVRLGWFAFLLCAGVAGVALALSNSAQGDARNHWLNVHAGAMAILGISLFSWWLRWPFLQTPPLRFQLPTNHRTRPDGPPETSN
jgi:hypothetical protein